MLARAESSSPELSDSHQLPHPHEPQSRGEIPRSRRPGGQGQGRPDERVEASGQQFAADVLSDPGAPATAYRTAPREACSPCWVGPEELPDVRDRGQCDGGLGAVPGRALAAVGDVGDGASSSLDLHDAMGQGNLQWLPEDHRGA
eukprot:6999582-Pyramimonas_sp.AAC.1